LGRVWNPNAGRPPIVTIRGNRLLDITSHQAPLVRDICKMDDPADYVQSAKVLTFAVLRILSRQGHLIRVLST